LRRTCIALGSDSTNVTTIAPRLNASMPTAPVPAYKSKTRLPDTRGPRIENKASRTLSDVGRRDLPCGALRRRPRWEPAMTRIECRTYSTRVDWLVIMTLLAHSTQKSGHVLGSLCPIAQRPANNSASHISPGVNLRPSEPCSDTHLGSPGSPEQGMSQGSRRRRHRPAVSAFL